MKSLFVAVSFSAVLLFAFCITGNVTQASTGDNVSGYAWSTTIGWVSFNCTNQDVCDDSDYGVSVDPATGNMTGYAWNKNIGWLSFNETSGCPEGDPGECGAKVSLANGEFSGWARAVSPTTDGMNGWDGWISLNCKNTTGMPWCIGTPSYSPDLDFVTGIVSGYAWGADVVGWMKFSGDTYAVEIDLDQPTASLVTSTENFCPGDTVTLTWATTGGMTSCSMSSTNADPAFNGSMTPEMLASGTAVVTPSAPSTTYTITCTAPGSDTAYQDSVTITMDDMCIDNSDLILSATPSPVTVATGYTTTLSWYSPTSTNFSSCVGSAFNVSVGVPPDTIAVPPTGFEGAHVGLGGALGYTQSDTGVYVSNTTDKFVIDCIRTDTGEHVLADTLVTRAILYPTCDFKEEGTFLSGSPTIKATLEWTSIDALTAAASSIPSVGITWIGPQLLNGFKEAINFTSPSTTYFLNVGAGAETSQCKAVLDEPVLCTPGVDAECTCDPDVPGGSCYIDPQCEDPNGCDIDLHGSVDLTASPDVFEDVGIGESVSTTLSWDTEYVEGAGTVYSFPTSSFGPVADCSINGSDTVSIEHSTTFILECSDEFTGETRSDAVTVYVDGDPACDMDPETLDIPDCIVSDGFTRPIYIER